MLLFPVLPGMGPSELLLPNNGCFDELLLLAGSGPHNEILSSPFVQAGGPYAHSLVDFYLMFTVSVV